MRQTENVVRDQRIDFGHGLRADIRVFYWIDLLRDARATRCGSTKIFHLSAHGRKRECTTDHSLGVRRLPPITWERKRIHDGVG